MLPRVEAEQMEKIMQTQIGLAVLVMAALVYGLLIGLYFNNVPFAKRNAERFDLLAYFCLASYLGSMWFQPVGITLLVPWAQDTFAYSLMAPACQFLATVAAAVFWWMMAKIVIVLSHLIAKKVPL